MSRQKFRLTRDVRCIHLPFVVPSGTVVSDVSLVRDGVMQGWTYMPFHCRLEMSECRLTLVVFGTSDCEVIR